jgi:hypothetical protein
MGEAISLKDEWEKLTPFNVLAVYVQPAVGRAPRSPYTSINRTFLNSLRRDNILLHQATPDPETANTLARHLVAKLPALSVISQGPLIAVNKKSVREVFSQHSRSFVQFENSRSFYVQYASELEASNFAQRVKRSLHLA